MQVYLFGALVKNNLYDSTAVWAAGGPLLKALVRPPRGVGDRLLRAGETGPGYREIPRTQRKRGQYGKRGCERGCAEGHRTTENCAGNAGGDPSWGGGHIISDPSWGCGNDSSHPGRPP